ncbi:MBL fold metallo-hydrolase [Thermodesulfovibrio hydrogeniphilus]
MFQLWQSLDKKQYLCKTVTYLPDKPGYLAKIAKLFATHDINITFFHFNRSEHPNRVVIEGKHDKIESFEILNRILEEEGFFEEKCEEELKIIEADKILKISVYIEHKPGTLAQFAELLKKHEANVVYMIYNEMLSENKAEIAFYVKDLIQIENLANEMNNAGYYYNFEYKGIDEENTNRIIGLNLIERFYLKLRKFLKEQEIKEVKGLIEASKKLSDTLVQFNKEAGKIFEVGQIYSNILIFAISSRTKTGNNFSYRRLPSIAVGEVLLHTFKLPTGGNIYIFQDNDEFTMIDGCYGLYYKDVKKMLKENGIEPSKIRKIYISHADADHVGLSGYFEEEFAAEVFMHPASKGIIEKNNRAFGSNTPLGTLNQYFTILVNAITETKFPQHWKPFKIEKANRTGDFFVIDEFYIGELQFKALESIGGHIPGQVFFLNEEAGLLFTADYLLYLPSLSEEEKNILSIPKFLMVSTNVDSKIFKTEMKQLSELAKHIDIKLKHHKKGLTILPGHGDYYPSKLLNL